MEVTGRFSGPHYRKHLKSAGNLFDAVVKVAARDSVNAERLHCHVQHCATVQDFVGTDENNCVIQLYLYCILYCHEAGSLPPNNGLFLM